MRNRILTWTRRACAVAGLLAFAAAPAMAQNANCRNTGSFDRWLADFKKEAAAQGISAAAINAASPYLVLDQRIIGIDRGQRFFSQNFLEFSDKMLAGSRLPSGAAQIRKYQPIFAREEKEFGVPAAVITGFWGLESDFGSGQGNYQALKSLATLAYDCRRSELFRGELMDALRLIERGDLSASEMRGAWAGEIGQTQFMPSNYIKYAVDFDSNGRRDLLRSPPDVLASTANFLVGYGWQKGKDYQPGSPNFPVLQQWNKSDVYARTIASFASQLAKAP